MLKRKHSSSEDAIKKSAKQDDLLVSKQHKPKKNDQLSGQNDFSAKKKGKGKSHKLAHPLQAQAQHQFQVQPQSHFCAHLSVVQTISNA